MLPAFDRERILSEAFVSRISSYPIDCKPILIFIVSTIELPDECGQNRMHIAFLCEAYMRLKNLQLLTIDKKACKISIIPE